MDYPLSFEVTFPSDSLDNFATQESAERLAVAIANCLNVKPGEVKRVSVRETKRTSSGSTTTSIMAYDVTRCGHCDDVTVTVTNLRK